MVCITVALQIDRASMKFYNHLYKTDTSLYKTDTSLYKSDTSLYKTDTRLYKTDTSLYKTDMNTLGSNVIYFLTKVKCFM